MKIETPKPTKDAFVNECFSFDFDEQKETRNWNELPETASIPGLGNGPNPSAALTAIEDALKKYPDFGFLYGWKGYVQQNRLRNRSKAIEIYEEGLKHSLSKISLLDSLGQTYYEENKFDQAVRHWIQSCALQMGTQTFEYAHPFMMLSYVAEKLGMKREANLLFAQTDRLQNIRLNYDGQVEMDIRIGRVPDKNMISSIKKAIKTFVKFYKTGK